MLPSNIPAEEALLGVILFDPNCLNLIVDRLPPEAFYLTRHQQIYKICLELFQKSALDLFNLASRLNPDNAGAAMTELTVLVERIIGAGDVEQHLDSVLLAWRRRRLMALGAELVNQAKNPALEVPEISVFVERELTDICRDVAKSSLVSLADAVNKFKAQLHEPHNAIPLQIPSVDRLLAGGLRPATFTVVAARPGMGKTWVGNFIARAIAGADQVSPAMVFSAEMNIDQLAARFVATEAQINLGAIMERRWTDQEFNALMLTNFDHLPIYFDDTVGSELTMAHIESQCQQVRRKHGAIGVVVVDYIQLLGNRGVANRAGDLGHYSGALVGLGKKLNCPVVALAQLNRGVESRNNKRPILSDLKESGDIEQDAFTVIFLHREDYYADEKPSGDEFIPLELIVAKNRNGPCGIATVQFQPSTGAIGAGPAIYDY